MRFVVAPLPRLATDLRGRVCLVVDVVRLSTFLVALLERGCPEVFVCHTPAEALALRAALPGALAFGEVIGSGAAPGCDAPPSLVALDGLDVARGPAIVSSENGAHALLAGLRTGARHVLVAGLSNLAAVAYATRRLEAHATGVALVCAGVAHNTRLTLDDLYVAGRLLCALGASPEQCDDGAMLALAVAAAFPAPLPALEASITGRWLRESGWQRDIEQCAHENVSSLAPEAMAATLAPVGRVCRVRR